MIKTVTLETAKKLKEAGFPQETEFYWNDAHENRLSDGSWDKIPARLLAKNHYYGTSPNDDFYAAPTAEEVLDELPMKIFLEEIVVPIKIYFDETIWIVGYGQMMKNFQIFKESMSLAEAAAKNVFVFKERRSYMKTTMFESREQFEERFWKKVNKTNTCWLWTGGLVLGYGLVYQNKLRKRAHRISYEMFKGVIPERKVIDHLCRNRACVNPDHLEAVSDRTNILRGIGLSAINARKTICKRGHLLSGENLYSGVAYGGSRQCKKCHSYRDRIRDRSGDKKMAEYHKVYYRTVIKPKLDAEKGLLK